MDRVRHRIGDKRVVGLVKAFLCSGVLSEDGVTRDTKAGTPQGGILSPLLANIALSVLDEHFADAWERDMATRTQRATRRNHGEPTYRIIRYADDFVVMVHGTRAHAEGLRTEVEAALTSVGLRLNEEKTSVCHIDEGFDFLGFRIQRQVKRGSNKAFVYTWPSRKSLSSVMAKVKAITRPGDEQSTLRPPASDQWRPAGLDELLPTRRVEGHLLLPAPVHLAAGGALAAPEASPCQLGVVASALPGKRLVARARWRSTV
jgi:hypothetical protein